MDYLKREYPLRMFREAVAHDGASPGLRDFDILIVDEAHNAAPSGAGKFALDSQRTQALREIGKHFEHKLFLTATPDNGYKESFSALLELLDDQRFARSVAPDPAQLRAVMVRRLKSEIKNWDGSGKFPRRTLPQSKMAPGRAQSWGRIPVMTFSTHALQPGSSTRGDFAAQL